MVDRPSTVENLVRPKMTLLEPCFWKGKKVFITGHTGFKGSWLSLWLQYLGAELVGFSLPPPTNPNMFSLVNVADGMTSIVGDIANFAFLKIMLQKHNPEIVIHLAAQPLVRYAYDNPIETYMTNVMGTVHLLEALRQTPSVKVAINVTTDKCYENKEWYWGYRETDRLGGKDPYSSSKACSELITSTYRHSYLNKQLHLASARAGNVIGGGDWAEDRLIPDIIKGCINQQTIRVRNPQALRPWQYVLEPLSGYLLLAQRLYNDGHQYAESWNFGPDAMDARPVSWIADYITSKWEEGASWIKTNESQAHEANYLRLECSKAKMKLGWQPCWNLEKGLQETIAWYKGYFRGECMREMTLNQIKKFPLFDS
jgi:CDP-glucose 4,6-dehydratase